MAGTKPKGRIHSKAIIHRKIPRKTILDVITTTDQDTLLNKYCNLSDIDNEASVESFFLLRLLEDLGYKDSEIKTKKSISELAISIGRKKENYKPDFVIFTSKKPRWLIDAKSTSENVDDWIKSCSGYALALNQKDPSENPVKYFAITNGLIFKLFQWDVEEPILSLKFGDFSDDNSKMVLLRSYIEAKNARSGWSAKSTHIESKHLKKPTIDEVKKLFNRCHKLIWNTENMSPSPAFFEFVKIMFIKMTEDKKLHNDPEILKLLNQGLPIPVDRLRFSKKWIERQESENPIDTILFQELVKKLEESIAKKNKKRIFGIGERINLNSATIKEVVSLMENYDMFGIDEDLNGRLFETFLNATMRGKELGQFFTPRSITKLMTRLSSPMAGRDHIDKVLDGCCGTGGFLIEVLTEMRNQIRDNSSLTVAEKEKFIDVVGNDSIFGVDAGKEPPIARIARLNMYLHGDGGSRIYFADGLDKEVKVPDNIDTEQKLEFEELKQTLNTTKFDIILTNPPFSKEYSEKFPEQKEVLDKYTLTKYGQEDTSKRRVSLRSSVMFIERYHDLLRADGKGKCIAVVDDSILSNKKYVFIRKFIREKFVIRAVVSLSGDAFQRAGARSKTSIIFLIRRPQGDKGQPDIFMAESMYIGLDDVVQKTPPSKVKEAKRLANEEMELILKNFKNYLDGKKGDWLVPSNRLTDRLDVKYCLPRKDDIAKVWNGKKLEIMTLDKVVEPVKDVIKVSDLVGSVGLLKVTYAGELLQGEKHLADEISYNELYKVQTNDIVISNIAAALGSTSVVPEEYSNLLASSEYTILRIKDPRFDPFFVWGYLRTPEIRARMLSNATGIARHRVEWAGKAGVYSLNKVPIPLVPLKVQNEIATEYRNSASAAKAASSSKEKGNNLLNSFLGTDNSWAVLRLQAAKPPQ